MQLENALGPQRQKFVSIVARKLHEEQPWYHGNISREAADRIMAQSEHRDGKFLYVCRIAIQLYEYCLHILPNCSEFLELVELGCDCIVSRYFITPAAYPK